MFRGRIFNLLKCSFILKQTRPSSSMRYIIDTDIGGDIDDSIALLFALKNEAKPLAITTTPDRRIDFSIKPPILSIEVELSKKSDRLQSLSVKEKSPLRQFAVFPAIEPAAGIAPATKEVIPELQKRAV